MTEQVMIDLEIVVADFDENRKDYQIQQLKQQLEEKDKEIKYHKAWALDFQEQLKEAVEIIEFYGNRGNWETRDKLFDYLTLAKIINEDDLDDRDSFFVKTHGDKKARQFLAKYHSANANEMVAKYRGGGNERSNNNGRNEGLKKALKDTKKEKASEFDDLVRTLLTKYLSNKRKKIR